MSNKILKKPFFIIFNIEASSDIMINHHKELEKLEILNKILNEGNTTLLLKEATKKNGNITQFFGFQNTFRTEQSYENIKDEEIILDSNKYYLDIETCKPVPENLNQEDIAEMYQEKLPTKLEQISNSARCMLISNNKKTCKFSHQIELNNRYITSLENLNILKEINYYQDKFFNLLIFDLFVSEKDSLTKELQAIEKIFDELDPSHYVSLLFSPFATKYTIDDIFKSFKAQIENNPLKDAINQIIPRQTYEFLYWEENKEFLQREKDLILMVQYSKDYCRQDKITNFAMLNDIKNYNFIGNKFINFELLWRELKFKMGKLPKFGA